MTVADAERMRDELVGLVGDPRRVSSGDSERDLHASDGTFHTPAQPDVVVYATSTEDVSRVLRYAHDRRLPVVPFGAGSSLEGHVIPVRGGISLDLTRMDAVLAVRPDDLAAVVQAGATRSALNRAAGAHGLHFPVDPGADATLGGMAATNAAGTTTVRYGKMRPNVLGLEAVLPGGDVIRTGSAAPKTSAGYDLTGLLVGSEGTLAVITELTLRLHGIPEHAVAIRLGFADLEAACRTATQMVAVGLAVERVELVDAWTIRAVNAYQGTAYADEPSLFVELAGSTAAVEADLELALELAVAEGAGTPVVERDPDGRARLWEARHGSAYATTAAAPGRRHRSTDVCVPLSQLAASVGLARRELERRGLIGGIVGHAGDGNYHVAIMVDPGDPDELAAADELAAVLVDDALARGGTCTGEHGIGLGKLGALAREHGDLLDLYRGVKRVFDPHGIMNPGKVVA